MSRRAARLDARLRFAVDGLPGVWRFLGQATYADDDGRTVEHDWLRMAPVGDPGGEEWVAPERVRPVHLRVTGAA